MPTNVLLVDDSPETLQTLQIQYLGLQDIGSIQTAETAAEALAALEQSGLHLVSLDIHLGADNGLELCREVHQRFPDVFIVMCSLEDSESNRRIAAANGASYFLQKPFGFHELQYMYQLYSEFAASKKGRFADSQGSSSPAEVSSAPHLLSLRPAPQQR